MQRQWSWLSSYGGLMQKQWPFLTASQLNRQFQYVHIFSMLFHKAFFFRKKWPEMCLTQKSFWGLLLPTLLFPPTRSKSLLNTSFVHNETRSILTTSFVSTLNPQWILQWNQHRLEKINQCVATAIVCAKPWILLRIATAKKTLLSWELSSVGEIGIQQLSRWS